jgi:hypothetical protein
LFFTRWSADAGGPFPLRVLEDDKGDKSYELERTPGEPELFTTAKEFLEAVHGPAFTARHWTMDRYLGTGRYARRKAEAEPGIIVVGPPVVGEVAQGPRDALDIQGQQAPLDEKPLSSKGAIVVSRAPRARRELGAQRGIRARGKLSKTENPVVRASSISVAGAPARGIDLAARGHEVTKLLYAGFSHWIYSSGYDFEDVLQEVYRKILVANQGKAPWDPTKSSFGHYVHLVCRSALSNFHRKAARIRSKEQIGIYHLRDGVWKETDVASASRPVGRQTQQALENDPAEDLQRYILGETPYAEDPMAPLAAQMVPYIQAGHTLKDTALHLGVERTLVSKAMKLLRTAAAAWAH